ncbi:MAG: S8 family serine peptidase, partial [Planctomycetales bacterium]|nr:S8 family serine peptidase [Planctomycetales bacterium]
AIGSMSTGQRVAVVKFSGANRFLTTYTNRGRLTFATGGAARGHNASVDAISTAATPAAGAFGAGQPSGPYPSQHSASDVSETFSSDGPVRQFFTAAGVALTPGNFSATGGVLRNGVDITAADGVTTTTPGFIPFFGTSAAAPNAAAIAALALEAAPAISDDDLEAAMKATAIDIEAPGVDPVAGHGIVMASPLLADVSGEGPPGSLYVPITPCRIVDTRIVGGAFADREIRDYHVRGASGFEGQGGKAGGCGVPADATAVEASVTAVDPVGSGFFRAWPGDESMPNATFMNFARNEDITNTGSITLADSGSDDLTVRNFGSASQYVIDIQGYYVLPGDGSVYVSTTPCRVVDTRIAGGALVDREIRGYHVRGTAGFE